MIKKSVKIINPQPASKSPPVRRAQRAEARAQAAKYNKMVKKRIKQYKVKEKPATRKVKVKEAAKEATAHKQEAKKAARGTRTLELRKPKHHQMLYPLFTERLRTRPLRKHETVRRARSVLLPKRVSLLGKPRCCSSHDSSQQGQPKMLLFIQGT